MYMKEKKLAVIWPGIGYHKEKPLLYYATKMLQNKEFEVIHIEYHDMPQKIKGDASMMEKAAMLACSQTEEQLRDVAFIDYDEILFVGKSIGTIALSKYAKDHKIQAKQIWYTPLEATFSFAQKDTLAFIGDADPWSDVHAIKEMAKEKGIKLYSYTDGNHSLETEDVKQNLRILQDVMEKTELFLDIHCEGAIGRISRMEAIYNEIAKKLENHEKMDDAKIKIQELEDYYTSDLWKADFALDEEGKLPTDLPRGVLSEDGIYNLLERVKSN